MDCFFVLSGFVIAYKYSSINEKQGILKFYIKRFLRLLPLHYFCLSVIFIYGPFLELLNTQGFFMDSDIKKLTFILINILLILLISDFTNRKIEFVGLKFFNKIN